MNCAACALVASLLFSQSGPANPFRLVLEDGSSLPLTQAFPLVEVPTNQPTHRVIVARGLQDLPFIVIYYSREPAQNAKPGALLARALGGEELTLSQAVNNASNRYFVESPGALHGLHLETAERKLERGTVFFFLLTPVDQAATWRGDFETVVRGYVPPTLLPFEKQRFSSGTLLWGALLFLANIAFLWLVFHQFSHFTRLEEPD
jgi:hypothetical protein